MFTSSAWTNALYKCPSYKWVTEVTLPQTQTSDAWGPHGSYAYNGIGTGNNPTSGPEKVLGLGPFPTDDPGQPTWRKQFLREDQVVAPADMIELADSLEMWCILLPPSGILKRHTESWTAHVSGLNVTFADGHVAYVREQDLLVATDEARSRWNNDHQPHPEGWP
jgi:prepilin-type processing-associated H-X9-DG protein